MADAKYPADHAAKRPRTNLQNIRKAAIREFGSEGFGRSNVAHIAEMAGVTKQLIYHYYPRKEELYADAVNSFANGYFTNLLESGLEMDDPRQAIETFAHRLAGFYTANRAVTGLVIDQSFQHGATFKGETEVLRMRAQLLERLERTLQRGVDAGLFDPAISAEGFFLMAVVVSVGYLAIGDLRTSFLLPVDELDDGQSIDDTIVNLVMKGIALPIQK